MANETLLVPVQLDALVVNVDPDGTQGMATEFKLNRRSYHNLLTFQSPEPDPFGGSDAEMGVHLHWGLPKGLRHGVETPSDGSRAAGDPDSVVFHTLPNRWLVVRSSASVATKAWVLASDELVDSGKPNSTPFFDTKSSIVGRKFNLVNLGRTYDLSDWTGQKGEHGVGQVAPMLTALGISDVTFVAHAPGARGVVSFHDDMQGVSDGSLHTYLVAGWYAGKQKAGDPLASSRVQWKPDTTDSSISVAHPLDWAVKLGAEPPPGRTMLHGFVQGVLWDTTRTKTGAKDYPYKPDKYPDNKSVAKRVNVAVGNTFADALSTLIRQKAKEAGAENPVLEERLLEAFQYDLLKTFEEPGGSARLDVEMHNRWFGKSPGGKRWIVVDDPPADTAKLEPPPKVPPAEQKKRRGQLAALNVSQRELDIEARKLRSMQRQLAAYWTQWYQFRMIEHPKHGLLPGDTPLAAATTLVDHILRAGVQAPSFLRAVQTQSQHVTQLAKRVHAETKAVKLSKGQRLKPVPTEPFWHPNDPVVLVTGLGRSDKYIETGLLPCRLGDQVVSALSVTFEGNAFRLSLTEKAGKDDEVTIVNIAAQLPKAPDPGGHLPDVLAGLIGESLLVNPSLAPIIAKAGLGSDAAPAQKSVTDAMSSTAPGAVVGDPPAAFAAAAWAQPWVPLFLDWKVNYNFSYAKNEHRHFARGYDNNYTIDFAPWAFPYVDAGGSTVYDFHWTGGKIDTGAELSIKGRTFLTPSAHFTFLERLKQYVETHHDVNDPDDALLANAEKLLEALEKWDILAQSLSGLTSWLVQRDTRVHNSPPTKPGDPYYTPDDEKLIALLEDPQVPGSFPALEAGAPVFTDLRSTHFPPPTFFPLLAGHLRFDELHVTDVFGATQDLIRANGNEHASKDAFQPILPELLMADGLNDPRFVRMAPRIAQPTRLAFRLIDAKDDAIDVALSADSSPICGWLLPNHLDQGITVFDAAGRLLGEVLSTRTQVLWRPAPGKPDEAPTIDPQNAPHVGKGHLQDILEQLVDLTPDVFSAFLRTIDETLWTIDPMGVRDDQNLSVLIGRPLAVVRANLQLQLDGDPYSDACYENMVRMSKVGPNAGHWELVRPDGGLSKLSFGVRLGYAELRNDGLVGYFPGKGAANFMALHKVAGLKANDFLHWIGDRDAKGEGRANLIYLAPTTEKTGNKPGSFDRERSQYLTMLVDPRGVVHAQTGILPVHQVQLDSALVEEALERMSVTFNVGPILRDPEAVRMPRPVESKGAWSWIQAEGTGKGAWQTDPVANQDGTPRLSQQRQFLQEGWLSFTPEDIET